MDTKTEPKQSLAAQVFDIVFIFILAFICLVVPTELQGAVLVSWDASGAINFIWDPVGFFSLLGIIILFFGVILVHSVKHYRY